MKNNECPCKACVPPKRHRACWSSCGEYKAWNEEHISHKQIISAMKICDSICDDYEITTTRKNISHGHLSKGKYR